MIAAERLTKRFGELLAVDDLSFEVKKGEIFGFLGPNGAGKTTTVRMLSSLIGPTAGRAVVAGHDASKDPDRVRAAIGVLTESPGLYAKLTAAQNLTFFAELHDVDDVPGRVRRYLELLGLWSRRDDPVGGFSKGMQQKVALARALLHEPSVLFLDEPTSGLDPESARTVREFVAGLRDEGRTIFLCTHNLDEADRLCDRLALFKQRLVRVDTPEGLRRGLYGRRLSVRLSQATEALRGVAAALPQVSEAKIDGACLSLSLREGAEEDGSLVRALVLAGGEVLRVTDDDRTLEDVYHDVLGGAAKAGP